MLPLVRVARAPVRPSRSTTTFWRGPPPLASLPPARRPFATSPAWRSSEAVERPHSSTPLPEPEEKATELNLPLDQQQQAAEADVAAVAAASTGTPAAAGAAAPTAVEDEDGNLFVSHVPPVVASAAPREVLKGQVYVSNVFPVQLGKFDPRPLLASFKKEDLLDQFTQLPSLFPPELDFRLLAIEKQPKAGGVFLTYAFSPRPRFDLVPGGTVLSGDPDRVVGRDEVEKRLRTALEKNGGVKTWNWTGGARVWRVQGRPWHEDLNRFPASQVKVSFSGPDLPQEALYDLLRRYGHISTMTPPTPQPAGSQRFALLSFSRLRSSVTAVSCLHGIAVPIEAAEDGQDGGAKDGPKTTLRFEYQSPIKAHAVQDWISSHPRIALPVLAFLLGTFSYTVFDPIREFMVSSKILDRFSLAAYPTLQRLRELAEGIVPAFLLPPAPPAATQTKQEAGEGAEKGATVEGDVAWAERREAEKTAEGWLREYPSGFIVVAGPHGSGKTALVEKIIGEEQKRVLVIDCAALAKAKSDAAVIQQLARQTGYWPIFGFLSSLNHLIDLGAMGLIGQKAGFSTDFPTQVKQVLDVVTASLKTVGDHEEAMRARKVEELDLAKTREAAKEVDKERLRRFGYHDPRIDALAGNGIMSELGYGDEPLLDADVGSEEDRLFLSVLNEKDEPAVQDYTDREKDHIASLPVIVLKEFAAKGSKKDELWTAIADWAAGLTDAGVAQCIIISENANASSKLLNKALSSKPMNTITLADADPATALSFVAERLGLSKDRISAEEKALIGALGGRQTDLEGLVYKVRTGLTIADAMDDIISKSQMELRKALFGDDSEEAKSLPWTRAQAWAVVSKLAKGKGEVAYSPLLLSFPFKGAEDKLRKLEAAEVISVTSINGRPSTIRPGKPMYHAVFRRLVEDPVFHSSQSIDFNNQVLASNESAVKACEEELLSLSTLDGVKAAWLKRLFAADPIELRAGAILDRMKTAQTAINHLEQENAAIKAVLAKHV